MSMALTRTGAGAETDTYGYDLQNRMNSANISRTENGQSVTIAATYSYNDDGIRAKGVVTTTILLPDGQGSTRLLTDIVGTILARYAYDVYGGLLGAPVGVLNIPATSRL